MAYLGLPQERRVPGRPSARRIPTAAFRRSGGRTTTGPRPGSRRDPGEGAAGHGPPERSGDRPGSGGRIYVLPAWPEDWDVEFKLHAPRQTVVECVYRDGRIEPPRDQARGATRDVVLPAALVKDGSPLENQ